MFEFVFAVATTTKSWRETHEVLRYFIRDPGTRRHLPAEITPYRVSVCLFVLQHLLQFDTHALIGCGLRLILHSYWVRLRVLTKTGLKNNKRRLGTFILFGPWMGSEALGYR